MDDRFPHSFIFQIFKPFLFGHDENSYPRLNQDADNPSKEGSGEYNGCSPRDSLLKPDRNGTVNPPNDSRENIFLSPFHHPEEQSPSLWNEESVDEFFPGTFPGQGFHSMFGMMDQMFERMMQFHSGIFNDKFELPDVPSLESKPSDEEKKDTDLDDSKEIASLLKKPPSYQYESPQPQPPTSSSRFHSTSIVRIRRPDGVIEETRKYRDSSGREEIEVTTREPGSEGSLPSTDSFLSPPADDMFQDSGIKSFFKRFPPFSLF